MSMRLEALRKKQEENFAILESRIPLDMYIALKIKSEYCIEQLEKAYDEEINKLKVVN